MQKPQNQTEYLKQKGLESNQYGWSPEVSKGVGHEEVGEIGKDYFSPYRAFETMSNNYASIHKTMGKH